MLVITALLLLAPHGVAHDLAAPAGDGPGGDPREAYDVLAYRLDLRVQPQERRISGAAAVEFRVIERDLNTLVLDMHRDLEPLEVLWLDTPLDGAMRLVGAQLEFRHRGDSLHCKLPAPQPAGALVALAVRYAGSPTARNDFEGFHWREAAGSPWIGTSVQGLGAHYWWPCKASFFHPEDKHERLYVNASVPTGLTAVSNGQLVSRTEEANGWELFRWEHPYPSETYAVSLNVGAYVAIEGKLRLDGIEEPVPYGWYVLPDSEPKARLQFKEVPEIIACFTEAFGPWPFPLSKVGLVETSFWGMEHTTAVAYGSSYPAWIAEHGGKDRFANRNKWFDYILVHELAHEWWGNAVSASDWGDFWIHEGFATYAGGVIVEHRDGRGAADRFFAEQAKYVHPKLSLYRGQGTNSNEAYAGVIYSKGGCVLNTLRHYLDDDAVWWPVLREFQRRFRYANASTADFQAVLEELTDKNWKRFFQQWVYGVGYPRLSGLVRATKDAVLVTIDNPSNPTEFHVPLDLTWSERGQPKSQRLWLEPGRNELQLNCSAPPADLAVVHLERLLGKHAIEVR